MAGHGYLVLRHLAEDLAKELDSVLDGILGPRFGNRAKRSTAASNVVAVRAAG
jgi:hypothetical protein